MQPISTQNLLDFARRADAAGMTYREWTVLHEGRQTPDLATLDKLKVGDVEDRTVDLQRVPEAKRQESARLLKARQRHARAFVLGTSNDLEASRLTPGSGPRCKGWPRTR